MTRNDWLTVGLKLLGVYFGVSGIASLWTALLTLIFASDIVTRMGGTGLIGILRPAIYLLAAFFLVWRTGTCLRWCGEPKPEQRT